MGKSCCIKGCNVSSPKVEYFKFPRGGALLAAWVKATGAATGDVCSAHFTTNDYRSTRGKHRLLGTAVPSVFHNIKNKNKSTAKNKKGKKTIEKSIPAKDADRTVDGSTDKSKRTTDNNVSATDSDKTAGEAKIKNGESSQDRKEAESSKQNGKNEKTADDVQPEINDIEDMITNYQIKQTKTLAERLNPKPQENLIPAIMETQPKQFEVPVVQLVTSLEDGNVPRPIVSAPPSTRPADRAARSAAASQIVTSQTGTSVTPSKLDVNQLASHLADKLDNQLAQIKATAPVFIEVAVDQGATRAESPEDCLMLLESVQCDIDPSSLMLPEHGPETESDMEILECDTDPKTADPNAISLLTSSDEDEVIIEEPHIDTVEVSDETDDDDKPLQRFVRDKHKAKAKSDKPKRRSNYISCAPYVCVQCDFRTDDESAFQQHNLDLTHINSTTIQVCPTCNYTTASKAQFSRHKRKHRDERNYKCHLCNYKARHNMSLIYHLKSHDPVEKRQEKFTCVKCGFSSNEKSEAMNHLKGCEGNKYSCDRCSYTTKRSSDLSRHKATQHSVDDSDEELSV